MATARLKATNKWQMWEPGKCPQCFSKVKVLNIGRNHYCYCEQCKIKYLEGNNLYSSWREESKADWERNAVFLSKFKLID